MQLTISTTLNRPRDTVWAAFMTEANVFLWQPTLVEITPLDGAPGAEGSTCMMVYKEGKRRVELQETIHKREAPAVFEATYGVGGTANLCSNTFEVIDEGTTRWVMQSTFEFKGFMKLIAPLLKGMIKKRTEEDVARFKQQLEAGNMSVEPVEEPGQA